MADQKPTDADRERALGAVAETLSWAQGELLDNADVDAAIDAVAEAIAAARAEEREARDAQWIAAWHKAVVDDAIAHIRERGESLRGGKG